jgi:hypothetical protein
MDTKSYTNYNLLCTDKEVLISLKQPEKQTPIRDYGSVEGLRELASNEYYQYLDQHQDCLSIAKEIRDGVWSTGDKTLDTKFVREAMTNNISTTLCNVNARLLLIGNYIHRLTGSCNLSFKELYKIALLNNGLLSGMITSCNSNLYKSVLDNLATGKLAFKIVNEQSKVKLTRIRFLEKYPFVPIRVWTTSSSGTHATIVIFDESKLYSIDTAGIDRNKNTISIDSLDKGIYGRSIDHFEVLTSA